MRLRGHVYIAENRHTKFKTHTHRTRRVLRARSRGRMAPAAHAIEIDLNDAEAWDDSALIKAYDRAVSNYQVPPATLCQAHAFLPRA